MSMKDSTAHGEGLGRCSPFGIIGLVNIKLELTGKTSRRVLSRSLRKQGLPRPEKTHESIPGRLCSECHGSELHRELRR